MIVAAFIFWGVPNLIESMTGHQSPINDFLAATIALSLNGGAYIAEIVRGGIEAVPAGQMEASRSLGLPYATTMRKVILPQAVKLMLPNFINQFVISLKILQSSQQLVSWNSSKQVKSLLLEITSRSVCMLF